MAIIGSCGHQVENFDDLYQISTKAWEVTEEGWVRAIHYSSVCKECKKEYKEEGYILESTKEEYDWLKGEVDETNKVS